MHRIKRCFETRNCDGRLGGYKYIHVCTPRKVRIRKNGMTACRCLSLAPLEAAGKLNLAMFGGRPLSGSCHGAPENN